MFFPTRLCRTILASTAASLLVIACGMALSGCHVDSQPPTPTSEPYPRLPLADVPPWMQGTVYERVVVGNVVPKHIGGYSLVVNLHGTGSCDNTPTFVREYITKRIQLAGLGMLSDDRHFPVTPDRVFNDRDKRTAIVQVEADLPAGARAGQRIDLIVRAMPRSGTKSLACGRLWDTELSERGLDDPSAVGANVLANADSGDVFVNPVYALTNSPSSDADAAASLRLGKVMHGGFVQRDRPIYLQLREPQRSTARLIETLVRQRFPYLSPDLPWEVGKTVAAQDEGKIELYVPDQFQGDWKHYVGVVTHIFLNQAPNFIVWKANQLVQVAHQPGVPLMDVSYCWEAMGEPGLKFYQPLISDPDPAVAFAAARAGAFCGDSAAKEALLTMAGDPNNEFQLNAVQTLAQLPVTPEIRHWMLTLLDSEHAAVRLAAYRILVDDETAIASKPIGDHRFMLDLIPSKGPPLVYATSTGTPRIAFFGQHVSLKTPVLFFSMGKAFSISSNEGNDLLSIFYREPNRLQPRFVLSHNDLAEIVGRLGGEGPDADSTFDFSYGEVVALLQQMADPDHPEHNLIVGQSLEGQRLETAFVLEHTFLGQDILHRLPDDTTVGRPQGPAPATGPTARASN